MCEIFVVLVNLYWCNIINSRPYFKIFFNFFLLLFYPRIQYKMSCQHLVVVFARNTFGCDHFSDLPCFQGPWQFWIVLVRYFVECGSVWVCFIFSISHEQTEDMCLGRKVTDKVAFSSNHNKDTYSQHDLSLLMPTLITWVR